ncbi:hypothetical protein PCH70_16600 [Pseudomonas cichorii JBC1]|nr:hypothetical protein PCH70_16600 [Pseudomonas cichorii JBC1]
MSACVIDLSIPPFSVCVGCVPVFLEPASKGHRFSANTCPASAEGKFVAF